MGGGGNVYGVGERPEQTTVLSTLQNERVVNSFKEATVGRSTTEIGDETEIERAYAGNWRVCGDEWIDTRWAD